MGYETKSLRDKINWLYREYKCLKNCCDDSSSGGAVYTLSPLENNSFDLLENGTSVSSISLEEYPQFGDLYAGNSVIEGGVIYDSIVDQYFVWANKYIIDGIYYNEPISGYVTLPDGDATNPRIDIFVVQHDGINASINFVQGTASASPDSPDLTIEQAQVGFKIVAATETIPVEIIDEKIFNENSGDPGEWNLTTAIPGGDPVSTATPAALGLTSYSIPSTVDSGTLSFTDGTVLGITTNLDYKLVFSLKTLSTWSRNSRLRINIENTFQLDITNTISIDTQNGSRYNFDHTKTGEWQIIVVSFSDFNNIPNSINKLNFTFSNNDSDIFIDNIFIQRGGIVSPPSNLLQDLQSVLEQGPNAISQDGNSKIQFTIEDNGQGFNNLYTENLLGNWGNLYNDASSVYTGVQEGNQYSEISQYNGTIFIEQGDATGSFYTDLYFRPPTLNSEIYIPAPGTVGQKTLAISVNGIEADSTGNITLPASSDQDNIAKVINVTANNLVPFTGTTEERLALYINSLNYNKLETDAEIWVDYDDTLIVTSLQRSFDNWDGCPPAPALNSFLHFAPVASEPVPNNGALVYSNSSLTTFLPDGGYHIAGGDYIVVTSGVVSRPVANCE